MNTKSLTKQYATLTPWERVPLILAAIARQDDLEAERLKLMCTELKIDPDVLIRDLPGYDTLCRQEAAMRLIAFSAEEALEHFGKVTEELAKIGTPQENSRDYRIDTLEEVIKSWRRFLANRAERWM